MKVINTKIINTGLCTIDSKIDPYNIESSMISSIAMTVTINENYMKRLIETNGFITSSKGKRVERVERLADVTLIYSDSR